MNAPLRYSVEARRFPRLSPAQNLLQAAADREFMQQVIREMNLKPGISVGSTPDHPTGLEWGTAREACNVLR